MSKRGRYADGGNLQLQIAKGGTKAWVFAYQRNGVSRAMGLGSARSVPLALARELAARAANNWRAASTRLTPARPPPSRSGPPAPG